MLPSGISYSRARGFTLVELAIVIALFGMVLLVALNVFLQVVQSANKATVESELRQSVSSAQDITSRAIRRASCVSINGSGTVMTLYSGTLVSGNCTGTVMATFTFASRVLTQTANAVVTTLTSNHIDVTTNGSTFAPVGSSLGPVTLTIKAVALYAGSTRPDYSGSLTEVQTVALRQYSF